VSEKARLQLSDRIPQSNDTANASVSLISRITNSLSVFAVSNYCSEVGVRQCR